LRAFDRDLADAARSAGCALCSGAVHSATEERQFAWAIDQLYAMRGKAVERLAGKVGTAKLQTVIGLLEAVIKRQEHPQKADDQERA
jgi:hypothetical protein